MSSAADLAAAQAAAQMGLQPSPQHSPRGSVSQDPLAQIAALQAQVQMLTTHAQQQHAAQQQAASASVAAAPVDDQGSLGLKIRNPSMFRGDMGFVVDDWIHELGQQFVFYGSSKFPTEERKIRFALAYLTGPAISWWLNEPKKEEITTWDAFVARLHARFRPVQAAMVARQRLDKLSQKHGQSVNSYANIFQSTMTPITDMSPADQVHHFVNGLIGPIASKVWEKHAALTDLRAAIDAAVSVEAMGNYGRGASSSSSSAFKGRPPFASRAADPAAMDLSHLHLGTDRESEDSEEPSGAPSAAPRQPVDQDGVLAAVLSQMQQLQHQVSALAGGRAQPPRSGAGRDRVQGLKPDEIKKLMKEGRCFRCKQVGHMKGDPVCPKNE